jgi:Ca-activated chloride channel homolog
MRFSHPEYLLLMTVVPVLAAILLWGAFRGRKLAAMFAAEGAWDRIRPYDAPGRRRLRAGLILAGLLLIGFAAGGPKFGATFEQVRREGLDVVVAVDTSDSMLAQDVKPDRLSFAKREIERIVERLKGDRVALLPFAGEAYLLCPLTMDYSAINMFLGVIDTEIIPTGSTGIANAIDSARAALGETDRRIRAMILLTDGEDLLGKAMDSAKLAADEGIVVFVMGIGSDEGVPIPTTDTQGSVTYKKDRRGKVVISKLNESVLSKIASSTGGMYVRSTYDESAIEAVMAKLDKMEREVHEGRLITQLAARYQWFLVPGILLAMLGLAISPGRR